MDNCKRLRIFFKNILFDAPFIHFFVVPLHLLSRFCKSMSNKIRHEGIIDSIEEGCVHVRILQTSACAACKVAGYCNAAEAKEKVVDVFCDKVAEKYTKGQQVVVSTTGDIAARALLWAFGIPFILLVAVMVIVLWQTGDEGVAALSGLLSLVPYYGLLYLLRHRMRRQMAFTIESYN